MNEQLSENSVIDGIYYIVNRIVPVDNLEKKHIENTLKWIKSGAPIFRIRKPDVPDKHLVCYFCLFDMLEQKMLLVEHVNAGLWLPTGGHVEINEHPIDTVKRECMEELHMSANFLSEEPIFITKTTTVGKTAGHTDVSLWYVLNGEADKEYNLNSDEFKSLAWFSIPEIMHLKSDPHMHRFLNKLQNVLKTTSFSKRRDAGLIQSMVEGQGCKELYSDDFRHKKTVL